MKQTNLTAVARRTFTRSVAGLCAVAAVGAAITLAPKMAAAQPVNWTIASFSEGSSWYVYSVNLGELLREALPPGSTVDTPPIAGGLANPRLVAGDKAQIAFGMAVVGNWAYEGKSGFKAPLKNLRALVGGWDDYFLVPLARGTGFPSDLSGYFKEVQPKARVVLLARGSIGAFGGQQLLEIAGAGEDALAKAGGNYEFGSFDMVKNRFAGGTSEVFVQVATAGHPGITEIAQTNKVTFLQPSKNVLDEMTKRYGWGTNTMPKGTFPGQDKDVTLPSTTTTLFTSTDLSDDHAYLIVKTICEKTERLRTAHKALAKFDCAKGAWKQEVNGLPLHAGAVRYYKERGWIK
jgi:TRAP transporter TAXI family solute receptor